MKRRKILVLIPVLGLFLSGCTFQEGFGMVKNWIGDNVYRPAKEWIDNITGKGGEKEEPTPEPQPQPQPQDEVKYGTQEAPLSMTEFKANLDKVVDYSTIEEGATKTHEEAPFYVKGKVVSNEAISNGKIRFTNLVGTNDKTAEVTGYYLVFDSSLDSAALGAKDAMFAKEVVIKGYGILYNKSGSKVYEIGEQSEEGEKGTILSVADPTPTTGVNYGTKEAPLTASQACALLDSEMPSNAKMYVGGKVKSNTAWSTQYNNVDIVITDGEKDFTIYRTSTFPEGITKENITANSLKDFNVVASGIGKVYQTTYELNQGCVVEKVEDTTPKPASVTVTNATQMVAGGQLTLTATVGPEGAPQDVTWSIVTGEQTTAEGASIANGVLSAPNAGTVLVKATAVGTEVSGTALITVTAPSQTLITGIVATPASVEMLDNAEPVEISIEVSPSNYQEEVTWTISEGSDVISLANHKVSPLKAGSAKVRIEGATSHVGVTVNVTVTSSAPAKGSEANPYTVAEARAAVDAAEGVTDVYAAGIITRITYAYSTTNKNITFYMSDDGTQASELEAYKLSANENPGLEIGDNVVVRGNLKKFNSTYEFDEGCTLASVVKPTVQSVVVSGTATQTEYSVNAAYNHNGLVATATLSNGAQIDVSSTAEWAINPSTASVGDTQISIIATYKSVPSVAFVVDVTVSSVAPTPITANVKYSITNPNEQGAVTDCSTLTAAQINGAFATSSSVSLISSVEPVMTDSSKVYFGGNGGSGTTAYAIANCLKLGKSGTPGTVNISTLSTLSYSGVKLEVLGARDDGTLTINGVTKNVTKKAVKDNLEPMTLEWTFENATSQLSLVSKTGSSNFSIFILSIEFVA